MSGAECKTKYPILLLHGAGFTTAEAERFNVENPDVEGVFYQSFGGVLNHPLGDINLSTANLIVDFFEGRNDGLVSLRSAQWGERFTVLEPKGSRGVSHLDLIDLRRTRLPLRECDDITTLYINIARDLKNRGM